MSERLKRTKWIAPVLAATLGVTACGSSHAYAPSPNTSPSANVGVAPAGFGYDVSWPQCGFKLPAAEHTFVIVGINGGRANDINPCLSKEFNWARRSSGEMGLKAQLYLLAANPGHDYKNTVIRDWPAVGTNRFGTCNGSDSEACSFQYGYNKGTLDMKYATRILGITRLGTVYIDVENGASWQPNQADNTAAIEGFAAAIESADAYPGIYSDQLQLEELTNSTAGALASYPEWVTGGETVADTKKLCSSQFLQGARVVVAQLVQRTPSLDGDYLCPV